MSSNNYPERIDFISKIDKRLNQLEWYFRTRWHNVGPFMKAKPFEKGHLTLYSIPDGQSKTAFKYTTVCKLLTHYKDPTELDPTDHEDVIALSLPRDIEDYKKTWDGIDYVICEYSIENITLINYLYAPDLLLFIEKVYGTPVELCLSNGTYQINRADLITGVPMSELTRLGIIHMQDEIDWAKSTVRVVFNNSKFPTPKQFMKNGKTRFINTWANRKSEDYAAYWTSFSLKAKFSDRSMPIIVTAVDSGKTQRFDSLTQAARNLSQYGVDITIQKLSDCINGRQKTIKTGKGRIIVCKE